MADGNKRLVRYVTKYNPERVLIIVLIIEYPTRNACIIRAEIKRMLKLNAVLTVQCRNSSRRDSAIFEGVALSIRWYNCR